MAQIIPVSTLIKDQIELQSLKNDLLSKYRDINNRLEEKYQQRINHLMQQHASYQQELHSHYMHQLNYIQNQLMNIHCQLSMHESNKNQSNTHNNQTKQPEPTSVEHEDDDISQQQIIDSNPMDIDMTTHDIQCDNTNIPFSVTPIAINIENNTQQTVSIDSNRNNTNANDSSTTHRSVVRQQTLNVMRAIQSKRNDINDNNNNKDKNNKNNKRKRKKKKMDNTNDKKRKSKKRKRKYECVDEQIGNKRQKIDDRKFKRRRCSSLNSLSVSKIVDNVTKYESKHKVQTRGQTVRKQRMSKLRRSSLAFF